MTSGISGLNMSRTGWILHHTLYGSLTVAGVFGVIWSPMGYLTAWEFQAMHVSGFLTMVGAIICGVSWIAFKTRMWLWELVMVWPTAIGLLGFSVVTFTSMDPPGQRIGVTLTFALVLAMTYRGVELVQLSRRRREMKQQTEAVPDDR